MNRLISLAAVLVATTTALTAVTARADDQDVIDYREHIMKTMNAETTALTMIAQQKARSEDFTVHAQILAITAASALKAFEPKAVGGKAKPEVWDNWADFSKRLNELVANTSDLAKTAQEGGVAAAAPKLKTALTCNTCHDVYRQKIAPPPAGTQSESNDVVAYREQIMMSMDEQSAALGMILATMIPSDAIQAHFDAIALASSLGLKAFEPKVPGGEAKPEVWKDWPDFSKRMTNFATATAALAKKAREQGVESANQDVIGALSCKSCHDIFRNKK